MTIMTRTLGRTQADVTILGYGAMELRGEPRGPEIDDDTAGRLLNAVLDGGINLIDTSPDYGRSEELIGKHLGHRRDEFFLASKCGCLIEIPADAQPPYPHDYSPANVRADVEQSLRRLRTDRLDLVQVHMSPSVERARGQPDGRDAAGAAEGRQGPLHRDVRHPAQLAGADRHGRLRRLPDPLFGGAARSRGAHHGGRRDRRGTLIRGGAARGAPSEDKNWRTGPLSQPAGLGQRNWAASGIGDLLAGSGMTPMEFVLRFTLSHPYLSTTIVGTASPGHLAEQHRDRGEGTAARRPVRRGEVAPAASR